MIVITCADHRCGVLFHHRRQSQDRLLRSRVLSLSAGHLLWMNHYSFRQFEKDIRSDRSICVDENFLAKADVGAFCFVEGSPLRPWLRQIERIVLYRWNRDYPADTYLDIDLSDWSLVSCIDFPGSSHPTLTEEVYIP